MSGVQPTAHWLLIGRACEEVQRAVRAGKMLTEHMCINLGSAHIAVAKQLLYGSDIAATFKQMRGKCGERYDN